MHKERRSGHQSSEEVVMNYVNHTRNLELIAEAAHITNNARGDPTLKLIGELADALTAADKLNIVLLDGLEALGIANTLT